MIRIIITGGRELVERFSAAPARVRDSLEREMLRFVIYLQRYIILNKLEGQVLHHRTGNLERATTYSVDVSSTSIIGTVGTSKLAPYGKVHEYGGTIDIREQLRTSRNGKEFTVRAHSATYPERSYLRSSRDETLPSELPRLREAVAAVL